MSDVKSTAPGSVFGQPPAPQERPAPPRRAESGLPVPGWLVAGLVVAGAGYLAWQHFGPDFRRYLKIKSM